MTRKLVVKRKGYTRKGGVRVKGTTYKTPDKGKPGRTPKSKQWATWEKETGWRKTQSASVRRQKLLAATPKNWKMRRRYLGAYHKADQLAKVSTDRPTKILARQDAEHFRRKLK